MRKFHGELALALCSGSQLCREAKHAVERAISIEGEVLGTNFRVIDRSVALVEQADNVALELVGCGNGRLH